MRSKTFYIVQVAIDYFYRDRKTFLNYSKALRYAKRLAKREKNPVRVNEERYNKNGLLGGASERWQSSEDAA